MSSLLSARRRVATLFVLVAAFAAISAVPAQAKITPAKDYYLALGDSLAYGYHAAQFNAQLAAHYPIINASEFNDGYVDDFASAVRGIAPTIQTVNEGCPGETSDSLINGFVYTAGNPFASKCAYGNGFLYAWLHHPYQYKSQLDDAVAFLKKNPKKTSPITIDIGANNTLRYLNSCQPTNTCTTAGVTAVYQQIAGDLNNILTQLQAVAPNAGYVVVGLYNPYPAVINIGGVTGDQATAQLNQLEKQVATAHGAAFVDPMPVFNPGGYAALPGGSQAAEYGDIQAICSYTAMCPGGTTPFPLGYNPLPGTPGASVPADIHPTGHNQPGLNGGDGYQKMADLIFSATGY